MLCDLARRAAHGASEAKGPSLRRRGGRRRSRRAAKTQGEQRKTVSGGADPNTPEATGLVTRMLQGTRALLRT